MDIRFGPFTLDGRARQLRRGPQPVHISPKAFDLLALLVERRPAAISKADIHSVLWPDTFVSDINLAVLVTEIRNALGDDARHPRFVRTLHRFGYAFSGEAVETEWPSDSRRSTCCWVAWGTERVPLRHGENLLGRDPAAHVRIDAVGVSRRHAMIVLTGDDESTLHDLSSKNGTYIGDVPVTSPVLLTDGAEIRLGPAVVCFRRLAAMISTETLNTSRTARNRT